MVLGYVDYEGISSRKCFEYEHNIKIHSILYVCPPFYTTRGTQDGPTAHETQTETDARDQHDGPTRILHIYIYIYDAIRIQSGKCRQLAAYGGLSADTASNESVRGLSRHHPFHLCCI